MPGSRISELDRNLSARMIAAGKPTAEIAEEMGISTSSVDVIRKEKKALIERESARLLSLLPDAVGIQKKLIQAFDDIDSKDDPTRFKASVGAADNLLKAVGLHVSQSPGVIFQQINQDNRIQVISPAVASIIERLIPQESIPAVDPELQVVAPVDIIPGEQLFDDAN